MSSPSKFRLYAGIYNIKQTTNICRSHKVQHTEHNNENTNLVPYIFPY